MEVELKVKFAVGTKIPRSIVVSFEPEFEGGEVSYDFPDDRCDPEDVAMVKVEKVEDEELDEVKLETLDDLTTLVTGVDGLQWVKTPEEINAAVERYHKRESKKSRHARHLNTLERLRRDYDVQRDREIRNHESYLQARALRKANDKRKAQEFADMQKLPPSSSGMLENLQ